MRAKMLILGGLVAGCTVENPWFGLAGEGEGTSGVAGTSVGPGGDTPPTSQGPTATDDPATTSGTSTGSLTATEGTGATDSGASDSTGAPGPDMGAGLCGNHKMDPGEQCDDGNLAPGDACEANCKFMFAGSELEVFAAPTHVAAADLDGDARVDLVVTHVTPVPADPDFTLLRNLGAGAFAAETEALPEFAGAARVLIGQVVGDARPDLVFVSPDTKQAVLENTSAPGVFALTALPGFKSQVIGGQVIDAALADLNGDALADLLLLVGEKVLVLRNNKVGGFLAAESFGIPLKLGVALVAGPLVKADTRRHVAVAHTQLGADVSYMINDGTGKLTKKDETAKLCPTGALSLATGDAEQLGPMDLVVGCAAGPVALSGHDGVMAYTRGINTPLVGITSVGLIDLYGDDAVSDVYGVSPVSSALAVGVQQGAAFVATAILPVPGGPTTSTVADLDGDQAPDLVLLLPKLGKLALLRNQTRD